MTPLRTPILIDFDRALRAAADPAHRAAVRDHFGSNVDRFHRVKVTSRKDPEKVRRFVGEAKACMAPLVRRIALEKLEHCLPT